MTLLTRASTASIDTSTAQFAPQIPDLIAGEDLAIAAPCYIKSSDGKVYMSNGTAANEAAEFAGFTARAVLAGQPATLFGLGTRFRYAASGLTPGDVYYIGATAGRLDTAATTGDPMGVAVAVSATDIIVTRASPVPLSAVASGALVGTQVATVADANVIGGIPVVHRILVPSGANADVDVTLTHKTRVIDAWLALKGAGTAGSLVTVKNGSTAITDAMDVASGGDRDVFRAGEINDASHEIAAAGTLRVTKASTGGDFPGAEVYVLGVRVA